MNKKIDINEIKQLTIDMDIYNKLNFYEQYECDKFIIKHYDYRLKKFIINVHNLDDIVKYTITCPICNITHDITDYEHV
mgnify:CR=1 FL=1